MPQLQICLGFWPVTVGCHFAK